MLMLRSNCVLLVCLTFVARAAWADTPTLRIPRVTDPPVIDRYLDGTVTPPGVKVTEFVQREPGDGVPATAPTAAYLSYDATHVNVVFICTDDPAKVRANLTKREAIMGDDVVGLVLDTYGDGRRSYLFLVNPLGIQMDGVSTVGQDDDYSYDTLWQSDGRLTPTGYVVVIRIPFKSLRFSHAEVQTWGLAVARLMPRTNETSFWPYITRRIANVNQQLAVLEGIEGTSPGRNLLAIPYGNFAAARVKGADGEYQTDGSARVGVDAKAVIGGAVTVDATVNPDYSQVESDEPQVTINQRFEVFFPEKRPFFIENAGYFETPENLFFSRRIVDPKFGGRVTGKAAGWLFGGLLVNDETHGQDDGEARDEPTAGIGVVRVQREFTRQSHVGGIFTDREWGSESNRVYGVDGRWKIDDNWSLLGQWVGTRTVETGGHLQSGSALTAEVSRDGRNFNYESSYLQRSPGYRADLGFIRRVDMKEMQHEAGYSWHPKDHKVLRFGVDLEAGAVWDYSNVLQDWSVEPGVEVELAGQTEFGVRHWQFFERFEDIEFRRHSTMLYGSSEWLSWLNLRGSVDWGGQINYYPSGGLAPFLAQSMGVEAGMTLKPIARLRLDESYIYAALSTRDDAVPPGSTPGETIFTNHIFRTRVNFQFSRPFSVRAILDYDSVAPNTALVDLERERRFNADILFTYQANPWTAVYVGYSDAYENWRRAPVGARPYADTGAPLTSVGRQVFVKLSYLLTY